MAVKRFRKRSVKSPLTATGEHYEQAKFFQLISQVNHPAAKLTFAIPNGAVGPTKEKQLHFWREGLKSGVPDLLTAYPSQGFHGAFIEFKFGDNKPSETQYRWLYALSDAGYKCAVCYSADLAFRFWLDYLGIEST